MTGSFKPPRYSNSLRAQRLAESNVLETYTVASAQRFPGVPQSPAEFTLQINMVMRLDEVTAFQEKTLLERDWQSPKQVIAWLKSKGFVRKGSGQFGAVFLKPGYNRLIKISLRSDVCWLRFAHWTLGMRTNPAVPYISWVHTYTDSNGVEFFIALVEKLNPFNQKAIKETKDIQGLAYLYVQDVKLQTLNGPTLDAIDRRLAREGIINPDMSVGQVLFALRKYIAQAKGGKNFVNTLKAAEYRAKAPCNYDIHEGNLMYRPSDKRLVVIDPLADLSQVKL